MIVASSFVIAFLIANAGEAANVNPTNSEPQGMWSVGRSGASEHRLFSQNVRHAWLRTLRRQSRRRDPQDSGLVTVTEGPSTGSE
jgi:hypothetical protein